MRIPNLHRFLCDRHLKPLQKHLLRKRKFAYKGTAHKMKCFPLAMGFCQNLILVRLWRNKIYEHFHKKKTFHHAYSCWEKKELLEQQQ